MEDALSVTAVSKVYRVPSLLPWRRSKETVALRNVSFTCPEKTVSCLLGPNGAGKTTIIKILAGLVLPDAGCAVVLGHALAEESALRLRAKVGLATPNERSFYWRLTGRQNLDFYAALHGLRRRKRRERIGAVLRDVEMEADADKPFRLYSAGMKQKLLLARALLGNPSVLLLDEPTTHLDPLAQKSIHRIIRERFVGERKTTVLLCTHDLAEAQELGQHLIFLNEGSVCAEGSLAQIRERVLTRRRISLEFAAAAPRGWEEGLPVEVVSRGETECVLDLARGADPEMVAAVVDAAVRGGGRVVGCRRLDESLPHLFARLASGRST
jgi:ABC-2 type transport system ATP-binding protein